MSFENCVSGATPMGNDNQIRSRSSAEDPEHSKRWLMCEVWTEVGRTQLLRKLVEDATIDLGPAGNQGCCQRYANQLN